MPHFSIGSFYSCTFSYCLLFPCFLPLLFHSFCPFSFFPPIFFVFLLFTSCLSFFLILCFSPLFSFHSQLFLFLYSSFLSPPFLISFCAWHAYRLINAQFKTWHQLTFKTRLCFFWQIKLLSVPEGVNHPFLLFFFFSSAPFIYFIWYLMVF